MPTEYWKGSDDLHYRILPLEDGTFVLQLGYPGAKGEYVWTTQASFVNEGAAEAFIAWLDVMIDPTEEEEEGEGSATEAVEDEEEFAAEVIPLYPEGKPN